MAKQEIVEWHSSYSIGIPVIDGQHKELINLTNKLYNSCLQGWESTKDVFMKTIRGAVDYVGYHFSTEEKIMERVEYPYMAEHKKEHTDFVRTVLQEVDDFQSGKKYTPHNFVYYLRDWVLTHIAISDKKMGNHLLAMKNEGSLQRITLKVKKITKVEVDIEHSNQKNVSKRFVIE
ncbi:MAG: bacteriohemerythrin [Treponema sp.]|jgi:hemerythrin|nr:bacteriohemerythrin [Treponema sp.]